MAAVTPRSSSTAIRVFHLIKGLGRGGAEMLLADGPLRSAPTEFQYAFGYFVPWKNALAAEISQRIGPVVCFEAPSAVAMVASARRVAREVRKFDAQIIHCHMPLASVVGRIAGALARVPVVSTEHNVLERYHPATRMATLATWGMQRHVVAVSGEVARSIARHGKSGVPVTVVRNGVSPERFAPAPDPVRARRDLGLPDDALVVGTVAVFRSQKRLDLWLRAAARIAGAHPKTRFVVVGDGPLRLEVERQIDSLRLRQTVLLPGLQADVRPFLHAMDVYMISSDFEGLPVALLEAMSAGVIPVSTSVGGIQEVVSSDSGVLVPPGDPEALAGAVCALLGRTQAERARMASAARSRITTELGTEGMMRQIESIYREVLSRA